MKMENKMFDKIFGYENIKRELETIRNWYLNETIVNDSKFTLPKGILFYGDPGCGKTLFLKEYAKSFDAPTFIIEGKEGNLSNEVHEAFLNARKEKFALVLIDELDLLINENAQIERTLQAELDGINKEGNVLVIATTNNLFKIGRALRRSGRFDRQISVSFPDKETRLVMLKKYFNDFGIEECNIDIQHLAKITEGCCCSDIKLMCNDTFLRFGKAPLTENLEYSYELIKHNQCFEDTDKYKNYSVAVHEVGHLLMAHKYKEHFHFYKCVFLENGGLCTSYDVDEQKDTISKREATIQISLGGFLAEKVVFKKHDVGSYKDYEKAHNHCTRLIERVCVKGTNNLIPSYVDNNDRYESPLKRLRNEINVNKLMKKHERKTYTYLKKNKKLIEQLADFMMETGKITYRDLKQFGLN